MIDPGAIRSSVVVYCAGIGTDPLLVQGAGGNVSWKDADVLWVKASGTWLAQAAEKDIFVPVDLRTLSEAINAGRFDMVPIVLGESPLRPSIETMLHALMPQRIVVHLHAIEVLAHLVRTSWQTDLEHLLGDQLQWVTVPYRKPGAELAQAVSQALQAKPSAQVVFLQNHGVVIGADDVDGIAVLLKMLTETLRCEPAQGSTSNPAESPVATHQMLADVELQRLAQDPVLYARVANDWALYPDHVVFLGPKAFTVTHELVHTLNELPELIFVKDCGVFAAASFSAAKQLQLRCYFDVMVRQRREHTLSLLQAQEIGALLNWDAEQYRMRLSK